MKARHGSFAPPRSDARCPRASARASGAEVDGQVLLVRRWGAAVRSTACGPAGGDETHLNHRLDAFPRTRAQTGEAADAPASCLQPSCAAYQSMSSCAACQSMSLGAGRSARLAWWATPDRWVPDACEGFWNPIAHMSVVASDGVRCVVDTALAGGVGARQPRPCEVCPRHAELHTVWSMEHGACRPRTDESQNKCTVTKTCPVALLAGVLTAPSSTMPTTQQATYGPLARLASSCIF